MTSIGKMDKTLRDIRKWIHNHYSDADNAPLMLHILRIYADPLVLALQSIETSSEWMKHDVRELSRGHIFHTLGRYIDQHVQSLHRW